MCMVFAGTPSRLTGGTEIDRLIVAVNGAVITEGDLILAQSLNAIMPDGKSAVAGSRSEEIERLIDRELMRQELKNFGMAGAEESRTEARLQSMRNAYASKGGLSALLRQTGLLESELISYIRLDSALWKFVDFRFRPFAGVSGEEIRTYYEKKLIPQLRESKIEPPSLDQVSAKIEVILREEKINAILDRWIQEIRRSSRIEYFDAAR